MAARESCSGSHDRLILLTSTIPKARVHFSPQGPALRHFKDPNTALHPFDSSFRFPFPQNGGKRSFGAMVFPCQKVEPHPP